MKKDSPRPYRMNARAEAAAETGRRILAAATALVAERYYDEVSLAEIAREAGVTVQTVLRRFGSKEGLVDAAVRAATVDVRAARWAAAPGDLVAAVHGLVEHYELWGERSLRFLAQEETTPPMRRVTDAGRALHHAWVDHAFAPWLQASAPSRTQILRATLIAASDVGVWKVLRRDLGLDVVATEAALLRMLGGLLGAPAPDTDEVERVGQR